MKTLDKVTEEIQEEETSLCKAQYDLIDRKDEDVILTEFDPFYRSKSLKQKYGEMKNFILYLREDGETDFDEPVKGFDYRNNILSSDIAVFICLKKIGNKYLLKKVWERKIANEKKDDTIRQASFEEVLTKAGLKKSGLS